MSSSVDQWHAVGAYNDRDGLACQGSPPSSVAPAFQRNPSRSLFVMSEGVFQQSVPFYFNYLVAMISVAEDLSNISFLFHRSGIMRPSPSMVNLLSSFRRDIHFIGCAVFFISDYLVSLPTEVATMWNRPLDATNGFYFVGRYLYLFASIFSFFNIIPNLSDDVSPHLV